MEKKCYLHPGRDAVVEVAKRSYCKICQDGQTAAIKKVDAHVEPKPCFIWYTGSGDGWQPITGTGCAHWVSHQKNLNLGGESDQCLQGFTYRVRVVVFDLKVHVDKVSDVAVGDIWVNAGDTHMGLVSKVAKDPKSGNPVITIKHASSGQHMVAENDFVQYFGGKGKFYRL